MFQKLSILTFIMVHISLIFNKSKTSHFNFHSNEFPDYRSCSHNYNALRSCSIYKYFSK